MMRVAWVLVAVVFIVLLAYEVLKWREYTAEERRAESERQRLTEQINQAQQQIAAEMGKNTGLIQDMQWSAEGTDPSAFLNRMADLAREKRMTVLGIGPIERRSAPQFTKSWHTIQVQAPYREVRELAMRIEQDRGLIENLHLEAAPVPADQPTAPGRPRPSDEIRARFRMTALELTPEAKGIVERVQREGAQRGSGPTLALQVPTLPRAQGGATGQGPTARDPFVFLVPPPRASAPGAGPQGSPGTGSGAGPQGSPGAAPPVPLDLKGIVSFPDGFLAIVNNQIVKVGDTVSGHRVERITESSVTLTEPGASPRTINLPELAPAPAAAPKR